MNHISKILAICFFAFVDYAFCQQVTVELLFNRRGEFIYPATRQNRRRVLAENLLRHLNRPGHKTYIRFDSTLYNKWYFRFVDFNNGRRDTVLAGVDFRIHKTQPGIKNAFDKAKFKLSDSLNVIWSDIMASSIGDSLRNCEVEDNCVETNHWKMGVRERSTPLIVTMTRAKFNSMASDSLKKLWRIPNAVFRDSLNLAGITVRQFLQRSATDVEDRTKDWWRANILGRRGITADSTLWDVFRVRGFKKIWLRHRFFKNRFKADWIRRQSE